MRRAFSIALLAFIDCLLPSPAVADVFWSLADAGPKTPDVGLILGDDSRTLAFGPSGVHEYRSGAWVRTPLSMPDGKAEAPGAGVFFEGGEFFGLEYSGGSSNPYERTLYRLTSSTWRKLATFIPSAGEMTHDASFLYAVSGPFNECARLGPDECSSASPARLFTISLRDGTRRDGPLLPRCTGRVIAGGGLVYFFGVDASCAGPSARTALASGVPAYRLDGSSWTALPPLTGLIGFTNFFSSPKGVWFAVSGTPSQNAVRLLSASGLSDAVLAPRGVDPYRTGPVDWGSEAIFVTGDPTDNVFHLVGGAFVPFTPSPPLPLPLGRHVEVYAAGSRLFATADGYAPQVLAGGIWTETPGIEGTPRGDTYFASASSAFASRGGTFWKRTPEGWESLPRPPIGTQAVEGILWQESPVLIDRVPPGRLLRYSESSKSWENLVIMGGADSLLVSGAALCMTTATQVGCLRNGSWTFTALPQRPVDYYYYPTPQIRDLAGTVAVVAYGRAYRFGEDGLEPLFTDLPSGFSVRDVASAEGRAYLLVRDSRPVSGGVPVVRAVLVAAEPGYPTILTDREDGLVNVADGSVQLSVTMGRLFVSKKLPGPAFSVRDGQLHAARGDVMVQLVDPSGLFATTGSYDVRLRGSLLLPVSRVRKTLPAVVDTIGQGGVHYRTTLSLANFSPARSSRARVFPIARPEAVLEVPLPPMTQSRIRDPFPEFVGPVAVDFEGLDDEREAWASARVFSAVGTGTAGTSLVGVDPGSALGYSYLLPPAPGAGTRSHITIANAGDGAGQSLFIPDEGSSLAPGALLQRDLRPGESSRAIIVSLGGVTPDDLLGYAVRNDGATNDGTVVAAEPPDCELARRVRFLPAVVSLKSDAAVYRTELRFARNNQHALSAGPLPFHVLFRSAGISGEFDIDVDATDSLDVPDAGAWLVANGVAVDPASVDGTLTFASGVPGGAADLLVTAAVFATPPSGGEFGVSVPIANEGRWASTSAVVPGLLEDGAFRSNLALANPEPDGGPSVTLSVSLRRGSDGASLASLPRVTLKPGERLQFNRVASQAGVTGAFDGYAVVERTSTSGRFVAYGVLNDETTSDGTLLSMTKIQ